MKRLWEVDHQYYCCEGNYLGTTDDWHTEFETIDEFLEEYGDSDHDLNLIFRWDWQTNDPETDEPTHTGDDNARCEKLDVFFMGQRKAKCWSTSTRVCRNDEPKIIEFLKPRLQTLLKLWEPLV